MKIARVSIGEFENHILQQVTLLNRVLFVFFPTLLMEVLCHAIKAVEQLAHIEPSEGLPRDCSRAQLGGYRRSLCSRTNTLFLMRGDIYS